jgi:copper homeostasis protein
MREDSLATAAPVTVEICVSDVASAVAAEAGGAHRVELCDNLSVGGTTPSAGAIAVCCRTMRISVHVLIRPRAGDFVYSDIELAVMRHDIESAKELGAAGVVLGFLKADGTIDADRTAELVAVARPLAVTFHKAFDEVGSPLEALEQLVELGIDRLLTSGGRPTALEGVENLAELVSHANGRIVVMAGGRLEHSSVVQVVSRGKVKEVHLGSGVCESTAGVMNPGERGGSGTSWPRVDARRVAGIISLLRDQISQ